MYQGSPFGTPTRSRAGYDFAARPLSWISPAIRARVGIAIDEDPAGVFGTIGLASVNRVRAQQKHRALLHQHGLRPPVEQRIQRRMNAAHRGIAERTIAAGGRR